MVTWSATATVMSWGTETVTSATEMGTSAMAMGWHLVVVTHLGQIMAGSTSTRWRSISNDALADPMITAAHALAASIPTGLSSQNSGYGRISGRISTETDFTTDSIDEAFDFLTTELEAKALNSPGAGL